MLSSAVHQSKVYSVKYGIAIDSDYVESCMSIIDNPAFENDNNIQKRNVNGTVVPPISDAKGLDTTKPCYISVTLAPKDKTYTKGNWEGIRCINLTLTNTKPETDIEKTCPKFVKLFDTNYKNVSTADLKAVVAELEKVCK